MVKKLPPKKPSDVKTAKPKSTKTPGHVPCLVKSLPDDRLGDAAKVAVEVNPQNAPSLPEVPRGLMSLSDVTEPDKLTVLTGKKWGSKVDLGVRFLDTTDSTLKNKILAYANKWGAHGNIRFRESAQGEVRLARQNSGYWSYLGTDVLSIPAGQQTLNLQGFTVNTPDAEYDRVVVHEFGHTLGFPHEHERPEVIALLDREKTIVHFMRTQGWSRDDVIAQIFSPAPPGSIMASAVVDVRSIMCYGFPGSITKSGQPIPGGNVIDAIDAEFVGKVYPAVVVPPTPPAGKLTLPIPDGSAIAVSVADVVAALKADGYVVTKN